MNAFAAQRFASARRQRGFSLIVSLLMLIVIIILGVGAANMALNEERGSRNYRDRQIAFQAAEAALKDAEQELLGTTVGVACNPGDTAHLIYRGRTADVCFDGRTANIDGNGFVDGCSTAVASPGLCETSISSTPVWEAIGTTFGDPATPDAGSAPYAVYGAFTKKVYPTGGLGQPSIAPRYIIERVPKNNIVASSSGPPDEFMYRVTAIGFGPNPSAQVVLQSVVNTLD